MIQERVFAGVFTLLQSISDARYLSHFGFAPHCAELRGFAAKNLHAVENDREKLTRVLAILLLLSGDSRGITDRACP